MGLLFKNKVLQYWWLDWFWHFCRQFLMWNDRKIDNHSIFILAKISIASLFYDKLTNQTIHYQTYSEWFFSRFNVNLIISTHFRSYQDVPPCNRCDNHFIVLPNWNMTLHAHWYDILPGHITMATGHTYLSIELFVVDHNTESVSRFQCPSTIWTSHSWWTDVAQLALYCLDKRIHLWC